MLASYCDESLLEKDFISYECRTKKKAVLTLDLLLSGVDFLDD